MTILESQTVLKGVIDLVITVPVDDLKPFLEKSAIDLQTSKPLAGFRPGKAPYDAVRQAYGAMPVYEAALRYLVPASYAEIVEREHLLTIGDPEFNVLKLSPEQPVQFSVKVALLPTVKLGNYATIRADKKPVEISEKEIDEVISELRDTRASTVLVDRPATKEDRILIDLDMTLEGVTLDGGQAKNHAIDLFRPYVIPGFTEQLTGLKGGDSKKFSLPFPADHYDKKVAGKTVDYAVSVKGVHEYTRPEDTDEFAKTIGKFETVEELRKQLRQNLQEMNQAREEQRLERVIMDELIKKSAFGDIPELLIQAELQRIVWRMKSQVEREGGTWEDYLTHLKKTEVEMTRDVLPEAYTRVKAELLVRNVAEAEDITVTPEEMEIERNIILSHYPTDKDAEVREEIKSAEYDSHIKHIILTRKVFELLKKFATDSKKV